MRGTRGRIVQSQQIASDAPVAIIRCMVADEARLDQVEVMLRDAYLMKGVSHDHVSCVIMTCLDQPPLLIYSDLAGDASNLKTFLQHCKISEVAAVFFIQLLN